MSKMVLEIFQNDGIKFCVDQNLLDYLTFNKITKLKCYKLSFFSMIEVGIKWAWQMCMKQNKAPAAHEFIVLWHVWTTCHLERVQLFNPVLYLNNRFRFKELRL